jgi:hypothetical protein
MDRDDVERLVRVELGLEEVKTDLVEHRKESASRDEELKGLIEKLGVKIDDKAFRWGAILNTETVKIVGYLVLTLAGLAGAAKALLP